MQFWRSINLALLVRVALYFVSSNLPLSHSISYNTTDQTGYRGVKLLSIAIGEKRQFLFFLIKNCVKQHS